MNTPTTTQPPAELQQHLQETFAAADQTIFQRQIADQQRLAQRLAADVAQRVAEWDSPLTTLLRDKYMAALRDATGIRPEDLGAVRLALQLALQELHANHREQLAEQDAVVADLLDHRDQLRTECARLRQVEDGLTIWLRNNDPGRAFDAAYNHDIAAAIIALLEHRDTTGGGETVAPPLPVSAERGHKWIAF